MSILETISVKDYLLVKEHLLTLQGKFLLFSYERSGQWSKDWYVAAIVVATCCKVQFRFAGNYNIRFRMSAAS